MAAAVLIKVTSERYEPNDEGWRQQVVELWRSLSEGVAGLAPIQRTERPSEGSKGGTDTVLITLLSAAAVRAVTDALRLWLQRDRSRRVSITLSVSPTEEVTIRVDGDTVSDATVRETMMQALEHGVTGSPADGSGAT